MSFAISNDPFVISAPMSRAYLTFFLTSLLNSFWKNVMTIPAAPMAALIHQTSSEPEQTAQNTNMKMAAKITKYLEKKRSPTKTLTANFPKEPMNIASTNVITAMMKPPTYLA